MQNFSTQPTLRDYRGKVTSKGKRYRALKVFASGQWCWILVDPDGFRYAEGMSWTTKAEAEAWLG